jgi:sulfur carrier protein ThiS
MQVTLKLYATLTDYLPAAARATNHVRLDVPSGATVETLIAPFHLPVNLAHLLLINGVFVPRSERSGRRLNEGDVVAIWPPIAGG